MDKQINTKPLFLSNIAHNTLFFLKQNSTVFSRFFTFLAISCVVYFVWINKNALWHLLKEVDSLHLSLAIVGCISVHFILVLASYVSIQACDAYLPYTLVLKSYIKNIPARYIPGGIWHAATRAVDFHQYGLSKKVLTAILMLENLFSVAMAFILGGVGIIIDFNENNDFLLLLAIIFVIGSILVLILIPVFFHYIFRLKINNLFYIANVFIFSFVWIIFSLSFTIYFFSFSNVAEEVSIFKMWYSYLFSWGIGFLAFFAPQGIGVFEVTLSSLIKTSLPLSGLIVLITGFRIIIFFADMGLWIIGKIGRII